MDMTLFIFFILTLMLSVTNTLTLSVPNQTKTDRENINHVPNTIVNYASEGGPIESTPATNNDNNGSLPKEKNVSRSIVGRKGVSTDIVPTKEIIDNDHINNSGINNTTTAPNITSSQNNSNIDDTSIAKEKEKKPIDISKPNITTVESIISKKNATNSPNSTTATNVTTVKVTTKKHKPKPLKTIGEGYVDAPVPPSPTKDTAGMPRKIDYVIPVLISTIAIPILVATTYILYKRGRDCWDKRHYRRMDFLIDGMYND